MASQTRYESPLTARKHLTIPLQMGRGPVVMKDTTIIKSAERIVLLTFTLFLMMSTLGHAQSPYDPWLWCSASGFNGSTQEFYYTVPFQRGDRGIGDYQNQFITYLNQNGYPNTGVATCIPANTQQAAENDQQTVITPSEKAHSKLFYSF